MKYLICLIEDIIEFPASYFEVNDQGYLNLYDEEENHIACYKPDIWTSIEKVQEEM